MKNNKRGFAPILGIIIVLVLIAGGAYLYNKKTIPLNGCSIINNSIFQSVNKREMGNSPSGQVMGYAKIDFKDSVVKWTYSDVQETGTYSCRNNIVEVKLINRPVFTASYDANQEALIWKEVEYRKVK